MLAVGPGPCRNIQIAYNLYYIRVNIISRDEKVNLKYNFSQKNFLFEKIGRAVRCVWGEILLYRWWTAQRTDERSIVVTSENIIIICHFTIKPTPFSCCCHSVDCLLLIIMMLSYDVILLFLSYHTFFQDMTPNQTPSAQSFSHWDSIILDIKFHKTSLYPNWSPLLYDQYEWSPTLMYK